jgi:hypothetical protein
VQQHPHHDRGAAVQPLDVLAPDHGQGDRSAL